MSSLYAVLTQKYGVEPVEAEETIETASAAPREADLLDIDTGSPILVLGRHSFDADGAADRVRAQLVPRRSLHLRRAPHRCDLSTASSDVAGRPSTRSTSPLTGASSPAAMAV